jgi:hypothetical protein
MMPFWEGIRLEKLKYANNILHLKANLIFLERIMDTLCIFRLNVYNTLR